MKTINLFTTMLLLFMTISIVSAQPASERSPFTCTIWDDVLDIFRTQDCGSKFVGMIKQTTSQPYWKTLDARGNYTVEFKDKNSQKSELCFWHKTATKSQDLPNKLSIYDKDGKEIVQLNSKKDNTLNKYGYCRIVDTETYIKLNPTVVYQEDSTLTYLDVEENLEVNNTIKKYNGIEYVTAPNDLFMQEKDGNLAFGANDSVATEDTNYIYEITSNQEISFYKNNIYIVGTTSEGYKVIDFKDVCAYKECNFTSFNNTLQVYFVGQYNSSLGGVIIDPTILTVSFAPQSGNLHNQTVWEGNNITHLEINNIAEQYLQTDGTDDYFNIPSSYNNTGKNFTISLWMNATTLNSRGALIEKVLSSSGGYMIEFHNTSSGFGNTQSITWWKGFDSTLKTSTNSVLSNEWNNLVLRWNGTNRCIYVNGVLNICDALSPYSEGNDLIKVGYGDWTGGTSAFSGKIDELMYFNYSLNETEISNLYSLNRTDYSYSMAGVTGYWDFDNGAFNGADSSSFAVAGTYTNGAIAYAYDTEYTQFDRSSWNIPYNSLIAYYSFDADSSTTSYDLTNNNNDGTYTGNAIKGNGLYNASLILDGNGDYVTVPDAGSLDSTPYITISLWTYKSDSNWTLQGLIGKRIGATAYYQYAITGLADGNISFLQSSSGSAFETLAITTTAPSSGWHHFLAVNNGTSARLYIDGVLSATDSSPATSLASSTASLNIGNVFASSAERYLNGSIDEVMIFSKALNSTEISDIYNNQSKRFYTEGTVGFAPVGLNVSANAVNISLSNSQTNYGTSLQGRAGYWNVNNGYDTTQSLASGLVSYWTGDGNANDLMGINNLTYNSSANTTALGQFNNSFYFLGTNFANVSFTGTITSHALWIKNSTSTSWTHLYYNGSGYFTNGVFGSAPIQYPLNITGTTVQLGRNITGTALFNGYIDDVMIWNRTLTANEVKEIYNKGLANWSYTNYTNVTDNNILFAPIESFTSSRVDYKLLDGTNEGWYTPYLDNQTVQFLNYPLISFIPLTSNGSQAEGVQTIYYNVSLTYSTNATVNLYYSNGTLYDSKYIELTNLSGSFSSVPFGTWYMNATTTSDGITVSTSTNTIILSSDLSNPLISFISNTDTSGSTVTRRHIVLNTSVYDLNLKNITVFAYYQNGTLTNSTSLSIVGNTSYNWSFNLGVPSDGLFYFNATVFDTFDNSNSTTTRNVTVDTVVETLQLLTPVQNNLYNSTVPLRGYASDSVGIDKLWYNVIYTGLNQNTTYISNTTSTFNTTFNIADIGSYYINIYANDTAGNIGSVLDRFFHITNISQGPAGQNGSQGPQGPTGPQGPAGANGTNALVVICPEDIFGYYNPNLPSIKIAGCIQSKW